MNHSAIGKTIDRIKKRILNEIETQILFDFKNIRSGLADINHTELIRALSINRRRFSELQKIGKASAYLDCSAELEQLTDYLDNHSSEMLFDENQIADLVVLSLLLLNYNLVFKPSISIPEFLNNNEEEDYVFRGEKGIRWSLTPGIYRENDVYSFPNGRIDFSDIEAVYDSIDFNEKYNCLFPRHGQSVISNKYSFYQQYASLSPLLEFTYNLEIAVAFAGDNYDIDGCIYALNKNHVANNTGDWPEHLEITNYDHLLSVDDEVNGKAIYYLTHYDFDFCYSLVEMADNGLSSALGGCYILIQKAVIINNNLICPFKEKILQILSFDHETKRNMQVNNTLAGYKKFLAADVQNSFSLPKIDNYLHLKLKLAPDVVYRENSDGDVILIKADKAKVYNLTGSVGYLLNYFKMDYRSVQSLIDSIRKDFVGVSTSNLLSVKETLKQLIDDEIMLKRNELVTDFTPQLTLSKGRFYHAEELTNCAFELTYRCNEKCKYCYCVADRDKKELTLDELKNIMDQLYDMNVLELTFTGGDFFVRDDALEILKYAHEKGFAFNIFTNGTALTDSDLIMIKSLHPKTIHFSLFSHIAEKHDAFTQVQGSFDKTISVAKKTILMGIPTNIKFTVTSQNMDDVEGVLSMVEDLGATIQISTEVFSKNDGDSSTLQYCCYDQEKLFEVYELEKKHIVVKCSEGHTDLQYYGEDNRICGAGDHAISINPYGDVYACNALPIIVGNLRKQTVYDIWNHSEELKNIRNLKWNMIEGCEDCTNKEICNFCPGNSYTQNNGGIKKYDNACFYTNTRILYNLRKEGLYDDF